MRFFQIPDHQGQRRQLPAGALGALASLTWGVVMALEECPSCFKRISTKATSCPKCGEPLSPGWDNRVVRRRLKKAGWKMVKVLIVVFVIIPVGIVMLGDDDTSSDHRQRTSVTASIAPPASRTTSNEVRPPGVRGEKALRDMTIAFVGQPSRSEIRKYLDLALDMNGDPLGEASYRRAGSVLVVMRRETGVPEMAILRCMVNADVGTYGNFAEMAALCATLLEN